MLLVIFSFIFSFSLYFCVAGAHCRFVQFLTEKLLSFSSHTSIVKTNHVRYMKRASNTHKHTGESMMLLNTFDHQCDMGCVCVSLSQRMYIWIHTGCTLPCKSLGSPHQWNHFLFGLYMKPDKNQILMGGQFGNLIVNATRWCWISTLWHWCFESTIFVDFWSINQIYHMRIFHIVLFHGVNPNFCWAVYILKSCR